MMDADVIIEQLTSLSSGIIDNLGDSFEWNNKNAKRGAIINPLLDELYSIKFFLNSQAGFLIVKDIYSKLKGNNDFDSAFFNSFSNELTSYSGMYYGGLLNPVLNQNILDGYSVLRSTSNSLFSLITGRLCGNFEFDYNLMSSPKLLLNELNNLSDSILFNIGDSLDWESKSQERSALINPLLDEFYFLKLLLNDENNINLVKGLFTNVTGCSNYEFNNDFSVFHKILISSRGMYYGGFINSGLTNGISDGYSVLRSHINNIKCLLKGFIPKMPASKTNQGFYS